MVQLRDGLRLSVEALLKLEIRRERGRQQLDRHDAIEARVAGSIDLPHPAFAKQRFDLVRTETSPPGEHGISTSYGRTANLRRWRSAVSGDAGHDAPRSRAAARRPPPA